MSAWRIKPAIALSEAEERDAYPHPGRRLSRYEGVSREKPLPHVPVPVMGPSARDLRRKSSMRIPSHRRGQSYSQLQSLSHTSSSLFGASPPEQDPRTVGGAPRQSVSMHTLKTTTSQPMRVVNRSASFSISPAPPPGASGHRSSKKINQLIGHDLDLPVDPYGLDHKNNFSYAADYFEGTSSSNSGFGSDSGSDSDDGRSCFNMEEGLLPLLEEDEEGLSSRETSWVPRTPGTGAVPAPLKTRRHGSSPSVGSASVSNSEHSPTHSTGANFSLSSDSPMRWDPAYGQFTDKRAANDYHRFASELATPFAPVKPSVPANLPKRHTFIHAASPEQFSMKSKPTGKARASGTSAIYRLWDNALAQSEPPVPTSPPAAAPPTPPPSLPQLPPPPPPPAPPAPPSEPVSASLPATSSRRNTLKKQRPSRLSAADLQPTSQSSQHSLHTLSNSSSQLQHPFAANQCSAFDCDSDDEGGRGIGRRWWRRSDEEERRSSSEWPSVQWTKRQDEDKEKSSFGGGVKGLLANARDLALLSPAERRRSDLRKSIKVVRAAEPNTADSRRRAKK